MRFLKRLILAVLIYMAVYLPFIAVLQALTGTDLTAAFSVGGIVGAVELALGSIIKITENKEINKEGKIHLRAGFPQKARRDLRPGHNASVN